MPKAKTQTAEVMVEAPAAAQLLMCV